MVMISGFSVSFHKPAQKVSYLPVADILVVLPSPCNSYNSNHSSSNNNTNNNHNNYRNCIHQNDVFFTAPRALQTKPPGPGFPRSLGCSETVTLKSGCETANASRRSDPRQLGNTGGETPQRHADLREKPEARNLTTLEDPLYPHLLRTPLLCDQGHVVKGTGRGNFQKPRWASKTCAAGFRADIEA